MSARRALRAFFLEDEPGTTRPEPDASRPDVPPAAPVAAFAPPVALVAAPAAREAPVRPLTAGRAAAARPSAGPAPAGTATAGHAAPAGLRAKPAPVPAPLGTATAGHAAPAGPPATPATALPPLAALGPAPLLRLVAPPAAPRHVVLAPAIDATAAALAAAGALRREAGAPVALLALWQAPVPGRWLAARPAVRLAERLEARGHAATATGRLVCVALPPGDAPAAAELPGLLLATQDVPAVLAVGAARGPALDELLDRFDGAAITGVAPELGALAAEGLAARGLAARHLAPGPDRLDRALARIGRARRRKGEGA